MITKTADYQAKYKVSIKARKYISNKISGMSDYQAAIKAGYSRNTAVAAKQNIENPSVQRMLNELMERHGLTDEYLIDKLVDGLSKPVKVSVSGFGVTKCPDYALRHKYLETALKLKGYGQLELPKQAITIKLASISANKYVY